MSRVLPLIKKTAIIKSNIMLQPMEMDLGLGSLPDLLFGEELGHIAAVQQPLDEVPVKNESLRHDSSCKSLFEELEALNNGWKEDFELDEPMQTDECKVQTKAPSLNILEQAVSECDIISGDNQLPLVPFDDGDDTQNLISEMEKFLVQHESSSTNSTTSAAVNADTQLTESESKQAEEILDALIAGNISLDMESLDSNNTSAHPVGLGADDSGYLSNISNISEFVTDEGQKVVIVIANDVDPQPAAAQPAKQLKTLLPRSPSGSSLSASEADSDPDWAPSPAPVTGKESRSGGGGGTGRVPKAKGTKRGPYKRTKTSHNNILDKKERKKRQNVEAARRYRDKKKAEANLIGSEESQLLRKNAKLKSELGEMENEVKTLKKLMKELGLVK